MKVKKILLSLLFLFLIVIIALIFLNQKSINKIEVDITYSLIEKQKELESKFKIEGYTIDNPNIILNPYGNSPLTAIVIFETEENVLPTITVKGKDKLSTFVNTFESSTKHYLPIYGLYANKENEITIEFDNIKKDLIIKTEALPDNIALPTEVYSNKDKLNNDLYFFTPSSLGYTLAYDVNGDVRWYFTSNALWKIDRLKNGNLLLSTERLINFPYYMTGLYEMDLLGKIYNEYSLPGGYHHDYYELDNGNLLIATDDFDQSTVEDTIVEMDRKTGNIIKTFDLKDILKTDDGKSENWTEYDWFHNNAVWYDKKTNSITLSGRHQDAVINIDYDSGKLNWIIGDPTNWSKEYQKYFFKPIGDDFEWQWSQHAAMITPEGYVFILDNGNNKSKIESQYVKATNSYTRGVVYKIDTTNMTIEQIWQYGKERGSEFYSPYISDVDYLNSNHYIVHSGGIVYKDGEVQNKPAGIGGTDKLVSDTVEILNDEIIFEIKLPTNNYRVEKMSLYNSSSNYKIDSSNRLGTLGITKVKENKFGIIKSNKIIDKDFSFHQLSIEKEIDRLVIKGRFKRENKVNILLYNNMNYKKYNLKVSKKPYTALCIDIFTEEENENGIVVTKYINNEGLKGKYSIYMEIDGILYNTGKYVNFDEK